MTDLYNIGSKEEVNGEFLVSITLHTKVTSDNSDSDYNFSSSTNQHMVFDHDPTHEDILAKAAEYNHNYCNYYRRRRRYYRMELQNS